MDKMGKEALAKFGSKVVGLVLQAYLKRTEKDIIELAKLGGDIRICKGAYKEPAEIAIKAALTGHMVLSTLHTNDAPGAITRLVDMGVEPFLIASATVGVMAQRLVRLLCVDCKEPYTASTAELALLGMESHVADVSLNRVGSTPAVTRY